MTELTILGGGPAGLAVAFYAHRAGLPFVLFEQAAQVGGLCRTFRHGEHLYDSGAHRFHDRDPEITRDVLELVGDDLLPVNAPSKIWDRGRFIDFPPTPLNLLASCGRREIGRIGLELLRARLQPRPVISFADFAANLFGETLSRRLLLNYSEKVWGLPSDQLSPDIATRRLHGMTLRTLLLELIAPSKKTAHIDGSFFYPRKGYGQIVESIERGLPPGAIRTRQRIVGLDLDQASVTRIHFAEGPSIEPRGRIVSTLPLPLLVRLLGEKTPEEAHRAAAGLRFRQIGVVFLRLGRPRLSGAASIYIPDPGFCISRLYEPKNRSVAMAPENETSVVVEVPFFFDDPISRISPEKLAQRVIGELHQLGLVDPREVLEWNHHLLANAYPVYSLNYSDRVRTVEESLAHITNLDRTGRAGLFFYSHLHDQLRHGKDYIQALVGKDSL